MKDEYKERYKVELKFSEKQLERMSALHIISMFMNNNTLKDIPDINPDWIENWKYKDFSIWYLEDLLKKGSYDTGRVKVRKCKKGFVVEMKFNWRSKGVKKTKHLCRCCEKSDKLNFGLLCENCTKKLKKIRKYSKFIYDGWRPKE